VNELFGGEVSWDGISIESVLEGYKVGSVVSTHHEWEESVFSYAAGVLTTDVEEERALIILDILFVFKEPLEISPVVLEVVVINRLLHVERIEVSSINQRKIADGWRSCCNHSSHSRGSKGLHN